MNKIHRVLWSRCRHQFVVVAENARSDGGGSQSVCTGTGLGGPIDLFLLKPLWGLLAGVGWCVCVATAPALLPLATQAQVPPAKTQLPTGGQVTAGQARVSQSGATMSITQDSARAVINWKSFDVGSQAQVNIAQPSSSSVLLNRITGNSPSQIFGRINANGQVILSNPNGVYFSPTATVDVGSLTATTHGIADADFMAGSMAFGRNGALGKVVNEGSLSAGLGGYIALLAPEVRNSGVVVAKMGAVVMAAGERIELSFDAKHSLNNVLVTPATVSALVDNGNAVQAPGGLIILSAQAANGLLSGVVRNTGSLEATGLVDNGGVIRLRASSAISNTGNITANAAPGSAGQGGNITAIADLANPESRITVDGNWRALGGELGGDGGFIDTSASQVAVEDSTRVSTLAPKGRAGTWLIDPTDFTISSGSGAQTSSGIGANTLQTNLAGGNISLTTDNVSGAGNGDLIVNASVAWSANTLTLSAYRHITINSALNGTGTSALVLNPKSTGVGSGVINLGANISTGGGMTFNGDVSLSSTSLSLTSSTAGVTVTGGVSLGAGVGAQIIQFLDNGAYKISTNNGTSYTQGTVNALRVEPCPSPAMPIRSRPLTLARCAI